MKLVLLSVLSLLGQFACGQSVKTVSIPTYKTYKAEADTSLWFKSDRALARKIQLPDLQKSDDTFYFRLWVSGQILDIWTINSKLYFGAVTSYAQRYNAKLFRKGIHRIDTVIYKRVYLPNAKAKRIFRLIDSLSITRIPSDNQMAGWHDGFDGNEFEIEISTPTSYAYKTYWTPRAFADTLWEAWQIQTLTDKLYTDFKLTDYAKQLKLLPGHYQCDGIEGMQVITLSPGNSPGPKISIFDWF